MATQPLTLEQRITALAAELAALPGREARLAWLVARGRDGPLLAEADRLDGLLVPGCLAKLWLAVRQEGGRFRFASASDSQIVQGLAAILCALADGCGAAELQASTPQTLDPLRLDRLLTTNRRDAASRLWEAIRASTGPSRQG